MKPALTFTLFKTLHSERENMLKSILFLISLSISAQGMGSWDEDIRGTVRLSTEYSWTWFQESFGKMNRNFKISVITSIKFGFGEPK